MLKPHPDAEFNQDGLPTFQRVETELESQLNDSGFSSRCILPNSALPKARDPMVRVEMVKGVERFESELPVESLREADAFKERKIARQRPGP
jgi:hypothetical protein